MNTAIPPTSTPQISSASAPGWTWMVLVVICLIIFIFGWISSHEEEKKDQVVQQQTVPALILMVDRWTPFSDPINYTFELDTQGDPISLRISTVRGDTVVTYYGKGELQFPLRTRVKGPVYITSLIPGKEARVRIWKVITVQEGW